jgi:hypothetical protein
LVIGSVAVAAAAAASLLKLARCALTKLLISDLSVLTGAGAPKPPPPPNVTVVVVGGFNKLFKIFT